MGGLKNKTEALLLALTKNCQTLVEQTHTKSQKRLEFILTKPSEIFSFKPPISVEGCWTRGFTSLEVYNSIFNITEENNKFELYTDHFVEISFAELKDELQEIVNF